jgi:hypothetical protein
MWVDFAYYTDVHQGNLLGKDNFNRYEGQAQRYIDYFTLGKASNDMIDSKTLDYIKGKVKITTCICAELFYKQDLKILANNEVIASTTSKGIASESVKSHSVTFMKENDFKDELIIKTEFKKLIDSEIKQGLLLTGLLNRGVNYV